MAQPGSTARGSNHSASRRALRWPCFTAPGLPHPALCWALPGAGCVAQGQHLSSGFTLTSGGLCKASWCSTFISCNTKLQGSTQRRTAITVSAPRGSLGRAARRRAAQPCPQQQAVLQRHREIGLLGGGSRRWAQL